MTPEQKTLANNIFHSIQVIMTEEVKKKHHLDTLEKQLQYARKEKERQTKQQLEKRGILL